jgi:hypothetical protein
VRTTIAALLTLFTSQAYAYGSSHEIVRDCTATATTPEEAFRRIRCAGYVSGVLDGYGVVRSLYQNVRVYCEPSDGMTVDAALTALVEWLRGSMDRASIPARSGVLLALREQYPCR